FPRSHAFRLGIDHFLEWQRSQPAGLEADDRAEFLGLGGAEELYGAVAEVADVFGIEWDRVGAAKLVTEVLVDEGWSLDAEIVHALRECILDHPAEFDFTETQVVVLVAFHFAVAAAAEVFHFHELGFA